MRGHIIGTMVIVLALSLPASAETIYSWTDGDGTRRFSNQPPPPGVTNYSSETVAPQTGSMPAAGQRRTSFDRMVNRATSESTNLERQRTSAAAVRAAERDKKAKAQRQRRADAQRQQLEARIDQIRNRGLSPTFTRGMQKAQIEKINKQIEALETESAKDAPATPKSRQSSY